MRHRDPAILLLLSISALLAGCGPRPRAWGNLVIPAGAPVVLAIAIDPRASSSAPDSTMLAEASRTASSAAPIHGHRLAVTAVSAPCDGASGPSESMLDLRATAGVVGPSCSKACVEIEGALYEQRLTMITPVCTAAAVVQQGFPIAFRLAWDDNDQAVLAASYARAALHRGRAILVSDGSVYGNSLATAFKFAFRDRGGATQAELVLRQAASESGRIGESLRAAHGDVIFLAADTAQTPMLLDQLARSLPSTPIMTADAVLRGIGCGSMPATAALCTPGEGVGALDLDGAYVGAGRLKQAGVWRSELDLDAAGTRAAVTDATVDAITLYTNALSKVAVQGKDGSLIISRQKLRDAIARQDYPGRTGRIRFDAFGERRSDVGAQLYQSRHGVAVAVASVDREP